MKVIYQPRIKGLKRIPKSSCVHPNIHHALNVISRSEGKAISYVISEIVDDWIGIDYVTGKSLHRKRA